MYCTVLVFNSLTKMYLSVVSLYLFFLRAHWISWIWKLWLFTKFRLFLTIILFKKYFFQFHSLLSLEYRTLITHTVLSHRSLRSCSILFNFLLWFFKLDYFIDVSSSSLIFFLLSFLVCYYAYHLIFLTYFSALEFSFALFIFSISWDSLFAHHWNHVPIYFFEYIYNFWFKIFGKSNIWPHLE